MKIYKNFKNFWKNITKKKCWFLIIYLALIVEIGHSNTSIVAFSDGKIQPKYSCKTELGGEAVALFSKRIISSFYYEEFFLGKLIKIISVKFKKNQKKNEKLKINK